MRELLSTTARGRTVSFNVPGLARAKARAASNGRRSFVDPETAMFQNLVKFAAAKALGSQPMLKGAVAVHMTVFYQPPISTPPSMLAKMLGGVEHAAKRPDIDNLAKVIMDGCQGVLYANDLLVVELVAVKVYAEAPGVQVTVVEIVG